MSTLKERYDLLLDLHMGLRAENARLRGDLDTALGLRRMESRRVDAVREQAEALATALEETSEQLQRDFAIRCRCDFITNLPAGIERCVGCRARDRIAAIDAALRAYREATQ